MKKMRRISVLLLTCIVTLGLSAGGAFADSTSISGSAWFDGSDIQSDFSSQEIADAITGLQPGDDVSIRITYRNDGSEETDWYMANEVLQTLEKADSARKVPEGTGTPENGGYTYDLVHTDKNGRKTVLFSNDEVGGDAKPADMEGLEQATNALDDWFYIQSLKQGEKGRLDLNIRFDGETEVNDYMDTDGGVMFRFAVELTKSGSTPDKPDRHTKTGDWFPLWLCFILMMLAGIAMLLLLLRKRRKDEGGEA